MFHELTATLLPALHERVTLVLNHVLASEPAAGKRLAAHAGKVVELSPQGLAAPLPALPPARWRITPVGWLEALGPQETDSPALVLRMSMASPLEMMQRLLAGQAPEVVIEGDAALAADAAWLVENLRWDVEADIDRVFGPAVAHQVGSVGRGIARAMRAMLAHPAAHGESAASVAGGAMPR
jgi:ubiquinone biosynthesis protein UbiJ